MLKKIYLFILLLIVPHIACDWASTNFFLDPGNENITFGDLNGQIQSIFVYEELPEPFTIAILNCDSTHQPTISTFNIGHNTELDVTIDLLNGQYEVNINSLQDYEKISSKVYQFGIKINNAEKWIRLFIQNLIDTEPIVEYNVPCIVKELQPPNFIPDDCIFDVTVADGFEYSAGGLTWTNEITTELPAAENELFLFQIVPDSQKTYSIQFQIVVKQELHFVQKQLYNFRTIFKNSMGYSFSALIVIELEDLPNMEPTWVTPFAIHTIEEESDWSFTIEARDGDTGINDEIQFDIHFDEDVKEVYEKEILLGPSADNKATISLKKGGIDRDCLENEIFRFNIIAFKTTDEGEILSTNSSALIVIEDINDNEPSIQIFDVDGNESYNITIEEEKLLSLSFGKIIVHDRDLENNAIYSVRLEDEGGIAYSKPFNIVPENGYQRSDFFKINVFQLEHNLDFEDEEWRSFDIYLVAQETDTEEKFFDRIKITINLKNWNDELPYFDKPDGYVVDVLENVTIDHFILNAKADDNDVGDNVTHTILGNLADLLKIDEQTGDITTRIESAFDYEKQTQVILQVMAQDELKTGVVGETIHQVFAQVTINVIDVNDETPEIKMPPVPATEENIRGGVVVTDLIEAKDPDTTAKLEFTILWDESSATKSGQYADPKDFEECFIIRIKNEAIPNNNLVYGELVANPDFVIPGVKDIDYEKFEVLYLTIQVKDWGQQIGECTAKAQITVRITDLNDNQPRFLEDTLLVDRNVVEVALAGTQIGTILAEDIDGPEHNNITYEIEPLNDEMPDDWFEIDSKGVIRVKDGANIDCDIPERWAVDYIIKISDNNFTVPGHITINIIDTNNKFPVISPFENEIWIKEKVSNTGLELTTVQATDDDRNEEHKEISYFIDPTYNKAGNYFVIDRKTGILSVQLNGETIFDYDDGDKEYVIPIEVYDSVTNVVNRNSTRFTVRLIDINDHRPEFIGTYSPKIAENSVIGTKLDELCAEDKDDGENAKISFTLDFTVPYEGVETIPPADEKIFKTVETRDYCIQLEVATSLQGYFGIWEVQITASDNGIEDDCGVKTNEGKFYVEITPFNYNDPEIHYPTSGSIRLSNDQVIGDTLNDVNGEPIRPFEAYDPDGGVFGEVEFRITPTLGQDADDVDYFKFVKEINGKTSNLQITKSILGKNVYHITCTAYDGGGNSSPSMDLTITFVNINDDLYFLNPEDFTFFNEKDEDLKQSYTISEGTDPMNLGLPEEEYEKIYYFLEKTESEPYFNLDHETRLLTLKQALDRNEKERHVLKVVLSRMETNAPNNPPDSSILTLNILVNGAGRPDFDPAKPTIFYPITNTLRLLGGQPPSDNLLDASNSILQPFEAFGKNLDLTISDITFNITEVPGEVDDTEYFSFKPIDKTLSSLKLVEEIDHPNPFNIRITAVDSSQRESDPIDLKIMFIDMNRAPYFDVTDDLAFITENELGLSQTHHIPQAIEPRNEGLEDNLEKVYYFIDTTYNPDDVAKFELDSNEYLTIRETLDREAKGTYVIRIVVTRSSTAPLNPSSVSGLLLTIIVLDVNDNPPVFEQDPYGIGITSSDRTGKSLSMIRATDLDLNETITYHIIDETFKATGSGIDAVGVSSFTLTYENSVGNLLLNFVPRASMVGHFEFYIEARDNDEIHKVRALVKIYIIADANRVTFVFVNKLTDLELNENIKFIADLFQEKFGYECNIDEIEPATDDNGLPLEGITNVRVVFIQNNEAIPAETIQEIASDVVFITQLKSLLSQRQLILQEVPTGSAISEDTNKAELLQTILIVLSVVLGILCAVLIIAFFLRTRNLRRQLKAMSTVDFGSTSSNLNRREAPTTNVFSVEGSNPVLNNNNIKPMFDTISVDSNESDFAGIQDDPTFKNRRESINPELIEEIRRKSINPMVNGKAKDFESNHI